MVEKKLILIIMDGWGLGKIKSSDAIQNANVPFVSSLYSKYPNTTLVTCGEAVGLPTGQMGNSEVGHLNLGAGRIVYQELERINVAIRNGAFKKNESLLNTIQYAKNNNKPCWRWCWGPERLTWPRARAVGRAPRPGPRTLPRFPWSTSGRFPRRARWRLWPSLRRSSDWLRKRRASRTTKWTWLLPTRCARPPNSGPLRIPRTATCT